MTLQHATLELRRDPLEDCIAFYRLIGFGPVEPPESLRGRAWWLQAGPTQVHLMPREEPVQLPAGHLAVIVRDYDGVLARLREAGHEPDPRPQHWGAPRAFVRDPAGNRVELMRSPPPDP